MPTILPITDFLDPQLDIYARLSENQLLNRCDPQNGIFIAESPKVIERALDAGCIPISFLTEDRHLENQALPFLERCPDIPFFSAPFEVLTQLTGFALTRGMLCAMKRPKLPSVEELCQASSRLVILENIMNPTNIGAIFRSAAALGMDGVLLTSDCSNPLYRRAIRVSMGTVFQIPWTFLDSSWPLPGISELKNHGFHTVSMALRCDSVSIDDPKLSSKQKLAVILGSEGEGLLDETIDNCDDTGIPFIEQISDCSHTLAVAPFTVHPVIDGDKSHIIAGEDNVCVLSNSQVITPEAAQVFDQPAADKSLLYRVEALLYAGTIEVRPGIAVIHQNFQVGVPMFFCVSG